MHVPAEHDVVEHRHAGEQRDVLKRAGDAERGDLRRTQPGDVAALETDRATGRPVEAADHVEQRGLAGAVRTYDRQDLTATDSDRHVLHRGDAAEAF